MGISLQNVVCYKNLDCDCKSWAYNCKKHQEAQSLEWVVLLTFAYKAIYIGHIEKYLSDSWSQWYSYYVFIPNHWADNGHLSLEIDGWAQKNWCLCCGFGL